MSVALIVSFNLSCRHVLSFWCHRSFKTRRWRRFQRFVAILGRSNGCLETSGQKTASLYFKTRIKQDPKMAKDSAAPTPAKLVSILRQRNVSCTPELCVDESLCEWIQS